MDASMNRANRLRLRNKLKYYHDLRQVGGYITPVEYIYIIEKFGIENHIWEPYHRKQIKQGETQPTWAYFNLDSHDLERV